VDKEKFFDWSARLGLLGVLLAGGLLSLGVGGHLLILLLAASFIASFLYVWYQIRLKATGRNYQNDGQGLLWSCLLPLAAMAAVPALALHFFALITRAH
jgi:hypothetical protein